MKVQVTADVISKARALAAAVAATATSAASLAASLDDLDDGDRQGLGELEPLTHMRRFFIILTVLAWDARDTALPVQQLTQLDELATNLLKLQGVRPRSSRFSSLFSELALARSLGLARRGDAWAALGVVQSGRAFATRGAEASLHARLAVRSAHLLLRLGKGALAEDGLKLPVIAHLPADDLPELWETSLRLLRWSGRAQTFDEQCNAYEKAVKVKTSDVEAMLKWERLAAQTAKTGDLAAMAKATGRGGSLDLPRYALLAMLWSQTSHAAPRAFVHVESLRRHHGLSQRAADETARLLTLVKVLEDCHDGQIPLDIRLASLDKVGPLLAATVDVEAVLLATAAMSRWLKSVQQPLRAAVMAADYAQLSLGLSGGRSHDLLGLGLGQACTPWERYVDEKVVSPRESGSFEELTTSTTGRAFAVTRIGFGALPKLLKMRFSGLFADRAEARARKQAVGDDLVRYLVQKIGALKGPVVKLAQMTSVIHAALPDEVYQAIVRLREDSPGMAPNVARAVVLHELGADAFTRLFQHWDDEPLAAASVGQIHRAVTVDGDDVVVKVQYPGLEDSIRADLKLLRLLVVPVYKVLFPAVNLSALAEAVETLVILECDFKQEALSQARARDRWLEVPGILVPKVYPEMSTSRVLTMDFVEGQRFSQFAQSASAEQKDLVGVRIATLMLTALFAGDEFNADPHPGNYLFQEDGTIALLDFGAMGKLTPERITLLRSITQSAARGELAGFSDGMVALGYVTDRATFDFATDMKHARELMRPLLSGDRFRFSYEFFSDVFAYYGLASTNRKQVRFDAGDVPLWRFLIGLQVLLCELEAAGDWSTIFWQAAGVPRPV